MFLFKKRKIGLALGGGAARGIAHLGILKIFEKNGFRPDIVVGTSMGAVIGAAFASQNYGNVETLIKRLSEILKSDEFEELGFNLIGDANKKQKKHGIITRLKHLIKRFILYEKMFNSRFIISSEKVRNVFSLFIPDINIEDLPVRFAAVALDLKSQQEIILTRGPLIKAVMASSAIPGIFEPVKFGKYLLIDGGWIDKVPAPAARRLGAKKVVAADVSIVKKRNVPRFKNGIELIIFSDEITNSALKNLQLLAADVVISPKFAKDDWYDFYKFKKFVKLGETATIEKLKNLKKVFRRRII